MKKTPFKNKPQKSLKKTPFNRRVPKLPRTIIKPVAGQIGGNKRKVKSRLSKLKTQLWQLCREIQIKRYGRNCYTCGAKELVGSNCHLGHFIPSSVCSTIMRYDLDNLKPCCYHCNINLSGNWIAYERHLIADGVDVQELKDRNEKTKGGMFREDWYEQKIAEYQAILDT